MKYKSKISFEGVNKYYDFFKNLLFLKKYDNIEIYDLNRLEVIKKIQVCNYSSLSIVGCMLLTDLIDKEKTLVIDPQNNQEIKYFNFLIHPYTSEKFNFYSRDYYYPVSSRKDKKNCRVKLSISDFTIEQYYDDEYYKNFPIYFILNDAYYISINANFIYCIGLESKKEHWCIGFETITGSKNFSFNKDLFCKDGVVYLTIGKNGNSNLYKIDGETGQITHLNDNFPGILCMNENSLYTTNSFDLNVFNFSNLEVVRYDFTETLTKKKLQFSGKETILTQDGLLYFIDGKFLFPSASFGIIDIATNKLVFKEKLKITDKNIGGILSLRILDNRIFAFASDETLHVFERVI